MAMYNEWLCEGLAVIARGAPISLNNTVLTLPSATTGTIITPFRRIILDVNMGAGTGVITPTFLCCSATNGTYVDITTANTTAPLLWQAVTGLATGNFYRFEFDALALGNAIAGVSAGTPGPYFRCLLTETSSNAVIVGATLYGVAARSPSADLKINPFSSTALTPVCPAANQYVNGSLVNAVPGTVTSRFPLVLSV